MALMILLVKKLIGMAHHLLINASGVGGHVSDGEGPLGGYIFSKECLLVEYWI
jgi:hypothetical protein